MNNKKKILYVLVMMFSLLLPGCKNPKVKMPRIKGKEVTFTQTRLESKLDRLKLTNKVDSLLEVNYNNLVFHEDNEQQMKMETDYYGVQNLTNKELWIDTVTNFGEYDAKATAKVKGYESRSHTYFDINFKTNNNFTTDDALNEEFFNGKYKIKKTNDLWSSNDFEDLFFFLETFDFTDTDMVIDFDLILDLHELKYKKLKFFERKEQFTIQLKINLADLKFANDDLYEIFQYYFALTDTVGDIKKFDLEYILVFEKNTVVDYGLNYHVKLSENENDIEEYRIAEVKFEVRMKYIKKAPKKIKENKYELIDELDDIIK